MVFELANHKQELSITAMEILHRISDFREKICIRDRLTTIKTLVLVVLPTVEPLVYYLDLFNISPASSCSDCDILYCISILVLKQNIQLLTYLFLNSWFIKREINIWQIYIYFYTDKMATSSDVLCSIFWFCTFRHAMVIKAFRTQTFLTFRTPIVGISYCMLCLTYTT
jgi:hypothetical protein